MRVSEIRVKRIRVNQGLGVFSWEILQSAAVNEFENRNANNGHLIICMTCM